MKLPRLLLAFAASLLTIAAVPSGAVTPAQTQFDIAAARSKGAMLENPHIAAELARRAEPLAQEIGNPKAREAAIATSLWLQAEAQYRLDDIETASPLIERAYALTQTAAIGSKLQADVLLTRGSVHGKQLKVAQALSDFLEAHRLFRRHGDQRHEAITLVLIGTLYFDARDYDSALRYLRDALEVYRADPGLAQSIFNTQGNVLQDRARYDEADAAFKQALVNARMLKSAPLESVILRNMARNQLLAGQVAVATRTIAAARRMSTGGEDEARLLDALSAQAALQQGRTAAAMQLADRVFAGVDLARTDGRYRYAHLTAVAAYRAGGRSDQALAHLEALKRLDDTATKLATETSTALMAAKFNTANRDAQIARLRDAERLRVARDALQRAKTERMLFLIGGGAAVAVMLLLAIALVTIRRSRDQVRAANADLAVTNGALGKALAAKTEFLATTSHEIRTPLNGILGMTQVMLADRQLSAPTRDRLTVVHGAGLTMRALVDDILDVAKMETGNLGLDVAPFAPAACVREASAIWAEQARAKGLGFRIDLDRCPPCVEGDAARVRQIVFNLLSNALKFTAQGEVAITADADAHGHLRLSVSDTGIGIPADKRDAVFESFRQADTSTTRQFGGTGLGLSICRNLADAMGGTVTLESEVGRGTTFIVTLPLPARDPTVPSPCAASPAVLVVDRNPIARAMLRTLLTPHAGDVAFATTVEEVRAAIAAGGVTQLLIDGATAQAEGDAVTFLAEVGAAAAGRPTTLLWPAGDPVGEAAVVAAGLTRVLVKPVAGAAVVAAMFGDPDEMAVSRLVSQAA